MALKEEFEQQGNFLFRYRTYLPIIVLVGGLILFAYQKSNSSFCDLGPIYWYLCLLVGLLGLAVRVYAVGHTPANTSGRNTAAGQVADELNQTGIYSLVRHPLYLGNFLMWLAIALLTANTAYIVGFILAYWLYYERIMYAEEAFLTKKFGEQYTGWASKVPAFVPKLNGFVAPKYSFSIKKVLKKEKNGVLALFGLFYLFQLLGHFATEGHFDILSGFWHTAFVISLIGYFILKYLKSKTTVLDEVGR